MHNNPRHIRQTDLVSPDILDTPITIVGAGGIGSFTTLAFAKCGFRNILVYDFDKIELHNISNQFYPIDTIGQLKVEALDNMINMFEGISIARINEPYTEYQPFNPEVKGVVVSAVDSMAVRKQIFNSVCRHKNVSALIDGRMGGNQLEVYTCKMDAKGDKSNYKAVLYNDSETANIRCTERAVIYNVLSIASWIVNQTRLVLEGKEYHRGLLLHLDTMQLITMDKLK